MGDTAEGTEHRPVAPLWTAVEQGFFAAAPPDLPGPAPEPLRFDDLEDPARPTPEGVVRLRRLAATATAASRRLERRLRAGGVIARVWLRRWGRTLATRVRLVIAAALSHRRPGGR